MANGTNVNVPHMMTCINAMLHHMLHVAHSDDPPPPPPACYAYASRNSHLHSSHLQLSYPAIPHQQTL